MKSELDEQTLKTIADSFEAFMYIVHKRSRAYFEFYRKKVRLGSFEDIESIEILGDRILASISYMDSKDKVNDITLDYPTSYLWSENWKEEAQSKIDEFFDRKEHFYDEVEEEEE